MAGPNAHRPYSVSCQFIGRQTPNQAPAKVRGSVHYVCIQHPFLLEVMRHGILCQERRLDLNLGADPFTLRMRCVSRVVASLPTAQASAERRTFNLLELPEVTPHFIADRARNVDLQFYNRHESPTTKQQRSAEESPKRTLIITLIVSVCSDNQPQGLAAPVFPFVTPFLPGRQPDRQVRNLSWAVRCNRPSGYPATIPFRP